MSLFLLSVALLVTLSPQTACGHKIENCLPSGITSTDVVSLQASAKPGGKVVKVTVAEKLEELGARCQNGKLVDAGGKEIRFYPLIGCWGNPPEDYQDQLAQQQKELAELRKRYRVIEMTCDSSGDLRLRASPPSVNP